MTVSFTRAKRENIPLLIAVEGGTGSGKTKSGLELLAGIGDAIREAEGREPRLAVVDTENRRALFYADDYQFDHMDMQPPFSPARFGEILEEIERAKFDAVMFDSFSHEWSGEGGVKEWADALEKGTPKRGIAHPRKAGDAWDWWKDWEVKPVPSPGNWSDPKGAVKPGHKWLVNQMLRSPAHIILSLRSEEKMKLELVEVTDNEGNPKTGRDGKPMKKTVVTPAPDIKDPRDRWVPECEKRLPFEISLSMLFLPSAPGFPIVRKPLGASNAPQVRGDRLVDRQLGKALAQWARGDAAAAQGQTEFSTETLVELHKAAGQGTAALREAWSGLTPDERKHFGDELERLKSEAAQNDPPPPPQQEGSDYDGV